VKTWTVVTSERRIKVKAERRVDAEKQVWDKLKRGEELLYIIKPEHGD
jgi:hypothetical protein